MTAVGNGETESAGVLAPGVLAGRACLVTGAGTGIGRAIALRMAVLGATVFGVGRRPEALAETADLAAAQGATFAYESCDVRDTAAITDLVARVGTSQGIDIVVNNAGGQFAAPAEAISRRGWDAVIGVNLNAVFDVTIAAFPYLSRRGGSVVNMSLSLVERGSRGIAHSVAARSGVLGLSRTLALEWAQYGIRVNCIGPGIVLTEGAEQNYETGVGAQLSESTPLGRPTRADEVAELAAFLASPAGAMMTGQLIQIDGGGHIGAGLSLIDDGV